MLRVLTAPFQSPRAVLRFGLGGMALLALLAIGSLLTYPPENGYEPLGSSASYLGSFDSDRNPAGWWMFSGGLLLIGLVLIRLTLARHRLIAARVRDGGALKFATACHLAAALCYSLLGLIPDADSASLGPWSFNTVHDRIAALSFFVMGLGLSTDGLIFLLDRRAHGGAHFPQARIHWPYATFTVAGLLAASSLGYWYVRCELDSSLKHWPGEGLYCFPMWEWFLIFFGPALMVWVTWILRDDA